MTVNGVLYFIDTFLWLVRNQEKYEVIHCQQMFGPAMVATFASFFIRKPIVVRVTTVGELGEVKHVRQMPLSSLRLKLLQRVSKWIALSHEMADELATLKIPYEKITIIPNSTEIPIEAAYDEGTKVRSRRELSRSMDKIGIFVGRLSEEKNLDVLIHAWSAVVKEYPDAHLLLLGEGGSYRNVESKLRTQVDRLALDKSIHFLGHVDNVKEYMLASDVFVLPSRTEGMSNSLVEALACGAAIVATNIPANSEICEDEVNSLLVPVGVDTDLSNAILRILESPDLARKIGTEARLKAEHDLSVDAMVGAYLKVYHEALLAV
jgi:glycosyltransferase involved in cell wall biosynthesis